jgi:hypothetical protein
LTRGDDPAEVLREIANKEADIVLFSVDREEG